MNIQRGLERVSAVWWGLWALITLAGAAALLLEGEIQKGLFLAAVGVAIYLAHRLTCWVIAGFFAPGSPQERKQYD